MGEVLPLTPPDAAFWRTRSMACNMDLNLGEAVMAERLSVETYAALVTRCRKCAETGACDVWLAEASPPREIPSYCRNAHVFLALKAAQKKEN